MARSTTTLLVKVVMEHTDDNPPALTDSILDRAVAVAADAVSGYGYTVVESNRTKTIRLDG